MKLKTEVLVALTSMASMSYAANFYAAWTGKGDGQSWSDANNWKGALNEPDPSKWVDGAQPNNAYHSFFTIDTDIAGFNSVMTNDLSDFLYTDNLTITGSKSITIVSDYPFGFRLENKKALDVTTTGEVTFDCPIQIDNYPYLMFQGPSKVNFMKDIYLVGRWRMNDDTTPATAEMHFYGRVYGEDNVDKGYNSYLEMTYGAGNVYFHRPVTLARAQKMGGIYKFTGYHFLASGNKVDSLLLSGYGATYCDCENAFSADQVMQFHPWYLENECCRYYFGTHDQVFDRIQSDETVAADGFRVTCVFGVESDMTLMLKGRADAATYAKAMGNTTIVWDSADKHTQTFLKAPHDTTGDLVVRSGTVLLDKNTTFLNVPKIVLGANGVIKLGAEQTVSPFSDVTAELFVEAGGKLLIPAGKSVSFKRVRTSDGKVWGAGKTYTSANVDWIDGEGSVTCTENVTSWTTATSGLWSDETRWTGAVPELSARVNISSVGAPYTVSVASDVLLANTALEIAGSAAKLGVDENINFTYCGAPTPLETDGPILGVRNGATFETAGRTFWTNFTGNIDIASDDLSVTSKLSLVGGMLTLFSKDCYNYKVCVRKGGLVEVKNDAVLHPVDLTWGACSLGLFGGRLVFSDVAEYRQGGSWQTIFGSGEVVFEDNSVYKAGDFEDVDGNKGATRPYFAPFESGLENAARLTFRDHAKFNGNSGNTIYIDGSYDGTRGFNPGSSKPLLNGWSFVTFASDASHVAGRMVVGKDEGTSEMRLEAGSLTLKPWDAGLDIALNNTTGRVYVTGGALDITGGSGFKGITVGECTPDGTKKALGEFYFAAGSVTHNEGLHAIGCGAAVGRYVQTGGVFQENTADVGNALVVGLAGGDGRFVVSNGTYLSSSSAWIGGSTRTEHQKTAAYANYHDAVGKLVVAAADPTQACNVRIDQGLYVGHDGCGEIEIGRASQASDNLLHSQSLELANGAHSTLRYTLAADGVGLILLGGDFNVSAGAKLVVDATRYAGRSRRFPLVNAKMRTGSFADEDVTLLVPEGYSGEIQQPASSGSAVEPVLQLCIRRNIGMSIIVR